MRTYDFLTVTDILQSMKGTVNWYDQGQDCDDNDDDRAFKLPSKYKESAGNQATRNLLSLFFVFIAMKVAGASLIVAVRIPGPQPLMMSVFKQVTFFVCLFQVNSLFFREEKEKWIRAKYEGKEFLQELPPSDFSLGEVSIQCDVSSLKDSLHLVCGQNEERCRHF